MTGRGGCALSYYRTYSREVWEKQTGMKVKTKVEDVARSRAKLTSKQRSSSGVSKASSSSSSSSSSAAASSTVELVDEPIMFYTLEDVDGEREQKSLEEGSADVQVQDQEHRPKQMITTQQERRTTSLRGAARTNKGAPQESKSKVLSKKETVLLGKDQQHAGATTTTTRMKNKKSGHEMNQHQKLQEPRGPLAVVHHDVEDDGYSDTRVRRPWRNNKSTSRRRSTSRFKISTSDLANWFGRDNARGKKMKSGWRGRNDKGRLDSGDEMNSSSTTSTTNLSAAEELYYNFVTMICLFTTVLVLGFIYFRRRKKPIQVGERAEDHRFHQNGTRTTARTTNQRRLGTSRNKRTSSSKGYHRSGLVLYDEPYDEFYEEESSETNNDLSGLSKRKKQQQMTCSSTARNPKSMNNAKGSFVKKGGKTWAYGSEDSDSGEEVPESTNSGVGAFFMVIYDR